MKCAFCSKGAEYIVMIEDCGISRIASIRVCEDHRKSYSNVFYNKEYNYTVMHRRLSAERE